MSSKLQSLLTELNELTSILLCLIDEQKIEQAVDLVDRRLAVVESIKEIFDVYPESRFDIQTLASELLLVDQKIITILSEKKNKVADQLVELKKINKAGLVYRNLSIE